MSNCGPSNSQDKNGKVNQTTEKEYLEKGRKVAIKVQSVLGKNLMNAIQTKGTHGALRFCNEKAITLTDSMSEELNMLVKRVSDQNRNAGNTANSMELEYIEKAKIEIEDNSSATSQLQEINGKMVGYYPIMTNPMCLGCHGNPKSDINAKTNEVLQKTYPNDKAVGYLSNQLRGIWVIEMEK